MGDCAVKYKDHYYHISFSFLESDLTGDELLELAPYHQNSHLKNSYRTISYQGEQMKIALERLAASMILVEYIDSRR